LREPDEIFSGVLDEGEEVSLVSDLKLRRAYVNRDPFMELCGADPYKFGELRKLGLINEQIDRKQRFFVPTDEEAGVAVLTALIIRYPILAADEEAIELEIASEIRPPQVVNLDQWIVAVTEPPQPMI